MNITLKYYIFLFFTFFSLNSKVSFGKFLDLIIGKSYQLVLPDDYNSADYLITPNQSSKILKITRINKKTLSILAKSQTKKFQLTFPLKGKRTLIYKFRTTIIRKNNQTSSQLEQLEQPEKPEQSAVPKVLAKKTRKKVYFYDDQGINMSISNYNYFDIWMDNFNSIYAYFDKKNKEQKKNLSHLIETTYTPGSGISIKLLLELKDAIQKNKVRAIVFDWDYTITEQNGITIPNPSTPLKSIEDLLNRYKKIQSQVKNEMIITKEDYVKFLIGSNEKYILFKAIFALTQKQKIPVFVLSSNKAIAIEHKDFTMDFFSTLGCKLYGILYHKTQQDMTKPDFLVQSDFLKKLEEIELK